MTTTDNKDRFERVWKEHVDELDKLKLSTTELDDFEQLDDIKSELYEIIETIAGEFDDEQT